nr:HWE histidine kinase domain-containing protein [Aurantimonas sp. CSK15Z-1]
MNFHVDLTNCDREPIHLLGHVQRFGFLIAVSMDWLVQHVSSNVGEFLDVDPETMPGEPLTAFLPPNAIHALRGRLQLLTSSDSTERLYDFQLVPGKPRFDIAIHVSGASVIVEAEYASKEALNPGALVKSMTARVQKTESLEGLFRECVRQLRAVTGFDRVMLYRFAGDGSGEVVAESVRSGIDSFNGLRYPATDIPRQARQLYVRNQIRIIADVNAEAVPVLPALNPDGGVLDLSLSVLRSVSPIHIEYLKNMGVGASLSISIVIDGQLWGLFALHHYTARHLPLELRSATELFGQMVSLIIEGRLYKERRQLEDAARQLHDRFLARVMATTANIEALADFSDELRDIIACDGFAVWLKGEMRLFGQCPTVEEISALTRFLNRAAASRIYTSDRLTEVYPPAEDFTSRAAGVLAIPVSRTPRDYLLFFRKEIVQTVSWAGNPEKPVAWGPNGPRLSPRKSFETWKETVHGQALGWTDSEIKAAEALRVTILEVLLRFSEEAERARSQANERQELLIAELNHRVRNILSLIRALIAQSKPGVESVDEFARIIGGRIQALARAHDQITSEDFSRVSLPDIVQTEVSAYIGQKASRVHLKGPDVLIEPSAFSTLALVFHELVTNSAKYGALSDSTGEIAVDWTIDDNGGCRIEWRERGGPAVTPPRRRGFGSTIIERAIPHDLGGEAELRYLLAGLQATFVLPPNVFKLRTAGDAATGRAASDLREARMAEVNRHLSLSGMSALIVEDNMIIALDAEQLMIEQGMAAVFIASSVTEARKIIADEAIDLALLDVNLGAETSFPLVPNLLAKSIPFIFVSGYGDSLDLPPEAEHASRIKKPFNKDQLLSAIYQVQQRGPDAEPGA